MSSIFTAEKIYEAFLECRKRKTKTANFLKFDLKREENLNSLLSDLQNKNYQISRHICFVVKKPKPREIFAADFRDRIFHHLIYNEIYKIFDDDFVINSYANRIGKGTHCAVSDLRKRIKGSTKLYYAKIDIQNFFRSIDRATLFNILKKKLISVKLNDDVWKAEVLWLIEIIVFHEPTDNYVFRGNKNDLLLIEKHKSLFNGIVGKGLPIGNLTSQFFANVYLNELDQFVIRKLKVGKLNYFRYADDMVIIHHSGKRLFQYTKDIDSFLISKLQMNLHPKKTIIQPVRRGVDFLGYFIKPTYTLVRRNIVHRFRYKFFTALDSEGFVNIAYVPMIKSYIGHFEHASSFNLMKKHILIDL